MIRALQNCHGIPVWHCDRLAHVSESRGLFKWKKIVVGNSFFNLPPREQQAIILHEVAHCRMYHAERRLLHFWLLCWPPALLRYFHAQELEADQFAARCGLGIDLAMFFRRLPPAQSFEERFLHPDVKLRIARLLGG